MSNPTLISGFEDVMSFIRSQEYRINALEANNKHLTEENKVLRAEKKILQEGWDPDDSNEEDEEEESCQQMRRAREMIEELQDAKQELISPSQEICILIPNIESVNDRL